MKGAESIKKRKKKLTVRKKRRTPTKRPVPDARTATEKEKKKKKKQYKKKKCCRGGGPAPWRPVTLEGKGNVTEPPASPREGARGHRLARRTVATNWHGQRNRLEKGGREGGGTRTTIKKINRQARGINPLLQAKNGASV